MSSATQTTGRQSADAPISAELQAFLDRLAEKDVPEELAARGQVLARTLTRAAEDAAGRAAEAWRESRPARRDLQRVVEHRGRQVGRWSRQAWRRDIEPGLRRAWKNRVAALGAAGAAVPAGRQLIEEAAAGMGLRSRPDRHWGAFFAGIVIGGLTGVLVALLTAPRSGEQTRTELATRAREAADAAGEWISVGSLPANGNGGPVSAAEVSEVESES